MSEVVTLRLTSVFLCWLGAWRLGATWLFALANHWLGYAGGRDELGYVLGGLVAIMSLALPVKQMEKDARGRRIARWMFKGFLITALFLIATGFMAFGHTWNTDKGTQGWILIGMPWVALQFVPTLIGFSLLEAPPMTRSAAGEPNDDEKKNEEGESDRDEEK